jgi:Mce-associated membrane protein
VSGTRRNVVLYALAVVLACACVVGGVLSYHQHQVRQDRIADPTTGAPTAADQDRYGAVQAAARSTALALTNIDYRNPQQSSQAVARTATGTFLKQYGASTSSLVKLITQYKSVLRSTVLTTAVSTVDPDSATVLVATSGKVSNSQTGKTSTVRNFRLVLDLVLVDGQWKTSDLEFAS